MSDNSEKSAPPLPVQCTKKKSKNGNGRFLFFFTRPTVIILLLCFLGFIYHPQWMNIRFYFGSNEEVVRMNFVSNFYLWTRSNNDAPEKLIVGAADKLYLSRMRHRKTFILIHGFTRTGLEKWIINMKNALLWREDCNVISVDWEAGSLSAGYYVIQARVPQVGEDVSKLVSFLISQTPLRAKDFHIIGHSLGAHISGFAGKYMNGTLGRITGLDPAGLAYSGASSDVRLDSSDASFVDVIHTHGCYTIIKQWTDCYGSYDNMGDADFWPNGGERQPACDDDGDGTSAVRESSNCHHGLAYVYFTESIMFYSTSTRFLARKCQSYDIFNNGSCECPYPAQYMGYNVNRRNPGVFYLNTSKTQPYGLLDPSCSPTEYSFVKILGLCVCVQLVFAGLVYYSLILTSMWTKKDVTELLRIKWNEKLSAQNHRLQDFWQKKTK